MFEAISDTGPILHLYEIGSLEALRVFDLLILPERVAEEVARLGVPPAALQSLRYRVTAPQVTLPTPSAFESEPRKAQVLQPTDLQVLSLARENDFLAPVLTDDLALRREVESSRGLAVGSFGILVRRFRQGGSSLDQLTGEVERLLTASTLHLSPPFRAYVRQKIRDLAQP